MSRWPSVKHFCSWLGLCPAAQDFWGQGAVAAGAPRRASRHRRPAPRRAHGRTTRRVPWGPSFGGCEADWAPPRPSRPRHTSSPGWSTACCNMAALMSSRASTPTKPVPRTQGQGHGPPSQGLGLYAGGPGHTRGAEPRRGRRTDPLSWHNTIPASHPLWGKGGSVFTRQHRARRKTRYHTPRLPLTPPNHPPSPG